jgi:hypothetical protein
MSIIDTWFNLEARHGRTVGKGLERIADATGQRYSHSYQKAPQCSAYSRAAA